MFWATFWAAQRRHSAKKPRRRRRLVSPCYRRKGSGTVGGLSKTKDGSSALVKHSAVVLAWCTYPQENPFFILFVCHSKPSAPALCLHCQWVVFLCASKRGAELCRCPCLGQHSKGLHSPWVTVLCGPVAAGVCLAKLWAPTPSRHGTSFLLSLSSEQSECILCVHTACLEMEADPCLGPVDPLGWDLTRKKTGKIFWLPLQLWSCSPEICANQFEGTVKIKAVILRCFGLL